MASKKMGVVLATFLVAGNMTSSGVFLLPESLAKIGPRHVVEVINIAG